MTSIFIAPEAATTELSDFIVQKIGRTPLESEIRILRNGAIRTDDTTVFYGIEPVQGTVILKAPIYKRAVEPLQWVELEDADDGKPLFHNTSDLLAVRFEEG